MKIKNLNKNFESFPLYSFETKLLNDSFYSSSYVKERQVLPKSTFLKLESYNTISNSLTFNKTNVGYAIPHTRLSFISVLNKSLKFKLLTFSHNFKLLSSDIYNLEKTLKSVKSLNNEYKNLLVLNAIKGGFKAYYFGLIGFLPRSQALYFFKAYLKTLKSCIKKISIHTFIIINYSSLFLGVPKQILKVSALNAIKISFYAYSIKKFSFFKKKKRFYNNLSMVFLLNN